MVPPVVAGASASKKSKRVEAFFVVNRRSAWCVLAVRREWLEDLGHSTEERSVELAKVQLVYIEVPVRSVLTAIPKRWESDFSRAPDISATEFLRGYSQKENQAFGTPTAFETPTDLESEKERDKEAKEAEAK